MLRQYETTFIVDAHLPTEQIDKAIERVTSFIEKHHGKVKHVNRWGKRRLAYEIQKKQYGYYTYVRFEAEGTFIKEFEQEFKLDSSIIRILTICVHKSVLRTEIMEEAKQKASAETETSEQKDESALRQNETKKSDENVERAAALDESDIAQKPGTTTEPKNIEDHEQVQEPEKAEKTRNDEKPEEVVKSDKPEEVVESEKSEEVVESEKSEETVESEKSDEIQESGEVDTADAEPQKQPE